jgi:tetratricopeptide (TPR) repeat protein
MRSMRPEEQYATPYLQDAAALAKESAAATGDDLDVLADVTVTRVFPNGLSSRTHQLVIRALTPRGVDQAHWQSLSYSPDRQVVRVERARILRKDGTVIESRSEGERNVSEPWYAMYYDLRNRVVGFPQLEPGDALELVTRVDDSGSNFFADYFGDFAYLQGSARRHVSEYVLLGPPGRTFYVSSSPLPGLVHTEGKLPDGGAFQRFAARDVPRLSAEPSMPGSSDLYAYVHVSTYANWDDVSRFYWGLVKDQLKGTHEIRAAAQEAIRNAGPDEASRIRAVYDYVVSNTRYVALEFGIHSFKPYPVETILSRRFGDCKDKAALMHAMLESLGIDSRLVLLRTRRMGNLDRGPASLAVFDHAILYVPKYDLYLDGTAEFHGSRELPGDDRGADALVIEPDGKGAKLRRVPEGKASDNFDETRVRVALEADGSAAIDLTARTSGPFTAELRRTFESPDERSRRAEEQLSRTAYPGVKVTSVEVSDPHDIESAFVAKFRGRVTGYASNSGSGLRFAPFGQQRSYVESYAQLSRRTLPQRLPSAQTLTVGAEIDLPSGWSAVLPEDSQENGPHGRYSLHYAKEGGKVTARREIELHGGQPLRSSIPRSARSSPASMRPSLAASKRLPIARPLRSAMTGGPTSPVVSAGPRRRTAGARGAGGAGPPIRWAEALRPRQVASLRRVSAIFAATLCGLGCARTSRPDATAQLDPGARLRRAEAASSSGPMPAAQAGLLHYLIGSDVAAAEPLLRKAAEGQGEAAALALCALGDILEDRLETREAGGAWSRAILAAPHTPFAEYAANRLLEIQGDSREVDDAILALAGSAPKDVSPRAARLLRESAARVHGSRTAEEDGKAEAAGWADLGALQSWRVAGPYAALRLFDLTRELPLDGATRTRAPARGPVGPTFERNLEFPDGDLGLELEPGDGEVSYAATRVVAARGGDYLAFVEGAGAMELRIDGTVVLSRTPYPREVPRAQVVPIALAPGPHEVLVRWSRAEGTRFRVALPRGDGAPSDLEDSAPAELSGLRAASERAAYPPGDCRLGSNCVARAAWEDRTSLRGYAEGLLRVDPDDPIAAWLLVRATAGDDRVATRAAVARFVASTASGAPALLVRAQEALRDPEVPERLGRSQALSDLAEATRRDPLLLRARLTAAALQRDSERYDDAARELDQAEAALRTGAPKGATPVSAAAPAPLPARLLLARARLFDAQGNPAAARQRAETALRQDPGRCDARAFVYQMARREGSLADQERFAERLAGCPDGAQTLASLSRERGRLDVSEKLLAALALSRPAQPSRWFSLAEVQASRGEVDAAKASLEKAASIAPRSAEPLRRLAGLLEANGKDEAATDVRVRALSLSPGDLQLRRQIALTRGVPILGWSDRDGLALARDKSARVPQGASAVRLLDHGAVEIYPDGGAVERIHTIARVLDKRGVAKFGEAQIPSDAQILHLRTIKQDGRTLEPEAIPNKEGATLPGLAVGDAVEIDYLRGISPRGPDLPGLALGAFFFRDDETPMLESTYELRAPADLPLEVDPHHVAVGPLEKDGNAQRFRKTLRNVPPLPAEPRQPGESEIMPWLQIGYGAGQAELVRSIADWALLRARPGSTTDDLARRAAKGTPRETAQEIVRLVADAVRGRSAGSDFSISAAQVLAQGRGNRLVVLKAALASAKIPAHVVLVRPFNQDPAPYRFPRGELYSYSVLRIDLPDGPAFVDPSFRLAPFDALPAFARGADAWVVPEPGEDPQRIRTPSGEGSAGSGRRLTLSLTVDAEGGATGEGTDSYLGFDGASLKDALERIDEAQRKQAIEMMLGRGLRRVELVKLSAEGEGQVSVPATLHYDLRAQAGRREGDRLVVPGSLLASRLSRRLIEKADRSLPMLVDSPEKFAVVTRIKLPAGMHLRGDPAPIAVVTEQGHFSWTARESQGTLVVEEQLDIPQQRIVPERYAAFADLCRKVDDAEAQDLVVAR